MPGGWGKANPKDLSIDFLEDLDDADDIDKGGIAAAMPEPSGVLYTNPNPDGSRKNCKNCVMFASKAEQCYIFAPDKTITADMVCGYHVYGKPLEVFEKRIPMDPVVTDLAGLEVVKGGTSCDNCVAYRDGECLAVYKDGKPAKVEALGCCARWVAK